MERINYFLGWFVAEHDFRLLLFFLWLVDNDESFVHSMQQFCILFVGKYKLIVQLCHVCNTSEHEGEDEDQDANSEHEEHNLERPQRSQVYDMNAEEQLHTVRYHGKNGTETALTVCAEAKRENLEHENVGV